MTTTYYIHGYHESKWGTARFDIVAEDEAKRLSDREDWSTAVHSNLDWPNAWRYLIKNHSLRDGEIETLLRDCAGCHLPIPTRISRSAR